MRSSDIAAISAGTLLGIVLVGSWIVASRPAAPREEIAGAVFTDIDGGSYRLGNFQGKVLLLNFFAVW